MDMNRRKKKIAIVVPKFGLIGGAEQFAARLVRAMSQRDYDFHVFARRFNAMDCPFTFHPTPIISFPRFLTTPSFAWNAGRKLKKDSWALIHSHDRIFAADIFTLHGVPHRYWVKEVRKKKYLSLFDRATIWVERQMVIKNKKSLFAAVSNLAKDIFLEEYPEVRTRMSVIHPGVDKEPVSNESKTQARIYLNSKYGIGKKERIILFASMNFEVKGLPEIIPALATVSKRDRNFKFIVAGKGDWKRYEIMTGRAGIGNHLIFAGVLSREELIRHYQGSDFYLMLSRFDTFGLVVLEAMANGLPVIISSRVGAKDLILDGENGFVIGDTSDCEAIASRILHLFEAENLRSMSEAACETAQRCSWQDTARKYDELYCKILASRPSLP